MPLSYREAHPDRIDIEAVYRTHGPMVLRRCRRMLGDEDRARDAMHDVFIQLMRHHDRLSDSAPTSLLWAIATRTCLNRLRSQRRRPEQPSDAIMLALADLPDAAELSGARALLGRLFGAEPTSSRVIAMLHYVDGMTLEETAAEVGLSVSGVRKRLRTLRERLGALIPEVE